MTLLVLVAVILLLASLGTRLFVIVGTTTILCFLLLTGEEQSFLSLERIISKIEGLTTKNVFLSIPFFVASGAVMTRAGIAQRLIDLAQALVGWLPGGLAVASVVACVIFAAISGSSPVTLVAVGSIMFPALVKRGYPESFACGLITSAGSLGCMIPPAISMLIYAICVTGEATVDPSELFLAGLVPALLIAGLLALYSVWVGLKVPGAREPFSWERLGVAFRRAGWALTLPLLVLGGIYGGMFTPTEAGAMALATSLVLTTVVHRDIRFSQVPGILTEAGILIGSLILIVVLAFGLNDFLAEIDAAGRIGDWARTADLSPMEFMLVVNVLLIVIGALMDSISATLVFAPILAPVAIHQYGIDPLHFGVVFVVNMEIGYLAPPVATNLFVASSIFRLPFGKVVRSIFPTLGIICGALLLIIYLPTISKGAVNWKRGEPLVESFPWEGRAVAAPVESGEGNGEENAPPETGRPLTMQEMMEKASKATEAEGGQGAGTPAGEAAVPPPSGRPLTMQEMMEQARQKTEAEDAAAGDAAPSGSEPPR